MGDITTHTFNVAILPTTKSAVLQQQNRVRLSGQIGGNDNHPQDSIFPATPYNEEALTDEIIQGR